MLQSAPVRFAESRRTVRIDADAQYASAITERLVNGVLSAAQMHRYSNEGFLAIPELCGSVELAWIRHTLLELFLRQSGRAEGAQFDMLGTDVDAGSARQPQIVNPSVFAPALLRTDYLHRLGLIARQILGRESRVSFDHSILKPAYSSTATPWHQDEAHRDDNRLRYKQVSFWMPLQHTPTKMGCMLYIPTSNRGPLLMHRPYGNDVRVHALECPTSLFDESLAVARPAAAGDCILHDGRTLHAALPNFSGEDRLAYIVVFTGSPVLARHVGSGAFPVRATASRQRRKRWLLRGGFVVEGFRKLRRWLRSSPRSHWRRVRTLMRISIE